MARQHRQLETTTKQALDGLAAIPNATFWRNWVVSLEKRIEADPTSMKYLMDADLYVAWLLISAECLCYRMRLFLYMNGDFQNGALFDDGYKKLLAAMKEKMPPEVFMDAELAVTIRHIIVHKGFPNLQHAPVWREDDDTQAHVSNVSSLVVSPSRYQELKSRFIAIHLWFDQNRDSTQFSFAFPVPIAPPE